MLIGKTVTIVEAKNKSLEGKQGLVIDETKHTFTIRTPANKQNDNKQTHTDITIIKDQIITIEETP